VVGTNLASTCWRDGNRVVASNGSELPPRCVRCGAEGTDRIDRQFSWASRWFLLFLPAGVAVCLILMSIFRRKSRVAFWLCHQHSQRQKRHTQLKRIGLGLIAAAIAFLLFGASAAAALSRWIPSAQSVSLGLVLVLLLGGIALGLYGYYASRLVRATHIGRTGDVWLSGVHPSIYMGLTDVTAGGRMGPLRSVGGWVAGGTVASFLVLAFVGWGRGAVALPDPAASSTPRPSSTLSASILSGLVRPTTPPPATPRPIGLRSDQIVISVADFPFSGYQMSSDKQIGAGGWFRSFRSSTEDYFYMSVDIWVYGADETGMSVVAAEDCSYTDPQGRPVKTATLTAEVLGDAAKACRYEVGTGIVFYSYTAATRNAAIYVESNPRYIEVTDGLALRDLVTLAKAQIRTIDRLAPR
jgi:hypothetical protein